MRYARANASKAAVLGVLIAVILGAAGFMGYRYYAESADLALRNELLEKGRDFQQKVSRELSRQGEKFNQVNVTAFSEEPPAKPKGRIEIMGRVTDDAALAELKKLIATVPTPPPLELVWNVKVVGK